MADHKHLRVVDPYPDDPDLPVDRSMPCDLDAERAVLGAALSGRGRHGVELLADMRELLDAGDFYQPAHEQIWSAICQLADEQRPTDPITVGDRLGPAMLRKLGDPGYLFTCVGAVPVPDNGPWFAQIVRKKAYQRRVIATGTRLIHMGRTDDEDDLRAAVRAHVSELTAVEQRGWPDPVPLGGPDNLPTFPLAALPGWLQDQVEAVAHETQTPPDLGATVALSVLATAAAAKARVVVREEIWTEPLNLYTVAALPPGTRKTPVFKAMLKPLLDAEETLKKNTSSEIIASALHRKVAEELAERTATEAAKASDAERPSLLFQAQAAAEALEALPTLAKPQLVAGNATVEEIATLLAEQGGRIAILSAESEIFSIMAGRYSGGNPAIDVFLYGHSGDMMRINRKSRAREQINEPALTLGICTQPGTLADLAGIKGSIERGLFARFLYTIPDCRIGERDSDPPLRDRAIHAAYNANIEALASTMADLTEPWNLALDPAAYTLRVAISDDYEKRLRPDGDLAALQDWGNKAVGTCMRIAGLLHLVEHFRSDFDTPISIETVGAAHDLIQYYTAHAMAAYDTMAVDPNTKRARRILEWLARTGATRLTARDVLLSSSRGSFPGVKDVEAALTILEQHGYLRRLPTPPSGARGGRPPSTVYEAHPVVGS